MCVSLSLYNIYNCMYIYIYMYVCNVMQCNGMEWIVMMLVYLIYCIWYDPDVIDLAERDGSIF